MINENKLLSEEQRLEESPKRAPELLNFSSYSQSQLAKVILSDTLLDALIKSSKAYRYPHNLTPKEYEEFFDSLDKIIREHDSLITEDERRMRLHKGRHIKSMSKRQCAIGIKSHALRSVLSDICQSGIIKMEYDAERGTFQFNKTKQFNCPCQTIRTGEEIIKSASYHCPFTENSCFPIVNTLLKEVFNYNHGLILSLSMAFPTIDPREIRYNHARKESIGPTSTYNLKKRVRELKERIKIESPEYSVDYAQPIELIARIPIGTIIAQPRIRNETTVYGTLCEFEVKIASNLERNIDRIFDKIKPIASNLEEIFLQASKK
ncbi:MAG: hypothetical protein AABX11_07470 [Nanoarchaeota archaeon]